MDHTELLSPGELREWLKVSRSKAAQICSTEVPSYRIGTLVRVRRQDVEEYLARNRCQPDKTGEPDRPSAAPAE
jgi:excisionase family DNA binding protein